MRVELKGKRGGDVGVVELVAWGVEGEGDCMEVDIVLRYSGVKVFEVVR